MATEKVRVFDCHTGTLTTIPASELAPGMIRVQIQGIEGDVWVDASQLQAGGELRHPPLPEPARAAMGRLRETFADVYPRTPEEWEDGFRQDLNMRDQIASWLFMQDMFLHFTAGRDLDPDQKDAIFNVINAFVTNGAKHVLTTATHRTLSRNRVKQMVADMNAAAADGMSRARAEVGAMFATAEPTQ
jgi:hypothetical protein